MALSPSLPEGLVLSLGCVVVSLVIGLMKEQVRAMEKHNAGSMVYTAWGIFWLGEYQQVFRSLRLCSQTFVGTKYYKAQLHITFFCLWPGRKLLIILGLDCVNRSSPWKLYRHAHVHVEPKINITSSSFDMQLLYITIRFVHCTYMYMYCTCTVLYMYTPITRNLELYDSHDHYAQVQCTCTYVHIYAQYMYCRGTSFNRHLPVMATLLMHTLNTPHYCGKQKGFPVPKVVTAWNSLLNANIPFTHTCNK